MEAERQEQQIRLSTGDMLYQIFSRIPDDQIEVESKIILHGAFRDLCGENGALFGYQDFGRAGGYIDNSSMRYFLDTLNLSNLYYWEPPYRGRGPIMHLRGDPLRKTAQRILEKVDDELKPTDWDELASRFVELIGVNSKKTASELLARG